MFCDTPCLCDSHETQLTCISHGEMQSLPCHILIRLFVELPETFTAIAFAKADHLRVYIGRCCIIYIYEIKFVCSNNLSAQTASATVAHLHVLHQFQDAKPNGQKTLQICACKHVHLSNLGLTCFWAKRCYQRLLYVQVNSLICVEIAP